MMKTSTSVLSEQDFGLGPGESWKGFVQLLIKRIAPNQALYVVEYSYLHTTTIAITQLQGLVGVYAGLIVFATIDVFVAIAFIHID